MPAHFRVVSSEEHKGFPACFVGSFVLNDAVYWGRKQAVNKHKIGFIGVGLMGHGMAKNLVEKGWKVTILGHRNRAPVDDLVGRGATEAKDVAGLVAASDIVFLCVSGTPEVEDLMNREGGVLASSRPGQIIVDTSTSQPASTRKLVEVFAEKGVRFVDAPLTRTPVEAEQGRLNTLVGADAATFAELEPVLKGFCENVFHMGEPGAGHVIKLINNFVSIGTVALLAEALVACVKMGVEPKKLVQLMSVGAIQFGHAADGCRRRRRRRFHPHEVRSQERGQGRALFRAGHDGGAGGRRHEPGGQPEPQPGHGARLRHTRQAARVARGSTGEVERREGGRVKAFVHPTSRSNDEVVRIHSVSEVAG